MAASDYRSSGLRVIISRKSLHSNPKILADVELEITSGPLDGLTLKGFTIFKGYGSHPFVTVPSRPYTNKEGETKYYWLLRSTGYSENGDERLDDLRQFILETYYEQLG